ncbi:MAG: NfeD family protein [Myxococcaceae bacterium]
MRRSNRTAFLLLGVLLALGVEGAAVPDGPGRPAGVRLIELEGVVSPLSARYLTRELEAARGNASLVVVRLDTPGGLESSMRQMTRAISNSPVPVVVYVAPSGARAASAGMFLTLAAHVAAMAPGTNIGAAHPVALGGGEQQADMKQKVVQDAAALARSLAQGHGRNAAWAERAVRESVSITAEEALREKVVELVSPDLDTLLRDLDGRRVQTVEGEQTLRTAGAQVTTRSMSFAERTMQAVINPDVAYILFTLGLLGVAAELFSPGMVFPGVLGALMLIVSLVAFGSLPINWAGLVLIAAAVGLFIAELLTPGFGVFGVGGLLAFILGSLMLYQPLGPVSPATPTVGVSGWVIAVMAGALGLLLFLVLRAVVRVRKLKVATGIDALIGRTAVADTDLQPEGTVRLDGEPWTAVTDEGPIPRGETVRVVGGHGVTLKVARPGPTQGEPSHA